MNITELIALAVIIVIAVIYLIYIIKKKGLRKTAMDAIIKAEETFQNGETKLEMAVGVFISTLRFPFNKIPASVVTMFIQSIFDEIKDVLHCKGYEEPHTSDETVE